MGKFLTPLNVEKVNEKKWKLTCDLIYKSNTIGYIIVPAGFVTDFASVPRLPFAYWVLGGRADAAAVIHDWLYTPPHKPVCDCALTVTRQLADKAFKGIIIECLTSRDEVSIVDDFFAVTASWLMWAAVRVAGWLHWK